jgi:hypothetical protein
MYIKKIVNTMYNIIYFATFSKRDNNMSKHLFFILLIVFFVSCNSFKGEQEIPAYVHIEDILLVDNPNLNEGFLDIGVDDVWVFVDHKDLGAYELPIDIPVLADGKHSFNFRPGIKLSGVASTRVYYPFFELIEEDIELKIGEYSYPQLKTRYQNSTLFPWRENFEDQSSSLKRMVDSDTMMIVKSRGQNDTIYGQMMGAVYLTNARPKAELSTNYLEGYGYEIEDVSIPIFVELSYKTNNEFGIGVIIKSGGVSYEEPIAVVRPSPDKWKRIYVNITPNLEEYGNIDYLNILFHAEKEEGLEEATILLDNLKLVTKEL